MIAWEERERWMLLACVLLAFALRIWQIDAQSLRGDEAFDVVFVQGSLQDVLNALRRTQPYPPLFHLFLEGWIALTGRSELALRFPAMWSSVLSVPLTYVLARLWFDRATARWATFLSAVQPLSIWFAQDSRMYAPTVLLVLLSTWFAAHLWTGRADRRTWTAYAIVTFIGLMYNYMVFFALAAQQLCTLWVAWREHKWSFLGRWMVVQLIMGLLYLPWVLFAWTWTQDNIGSWVPPISLWTLLWRVFRSYTVGWTISRQWAILPMLAVWTAMGVGVWQVMRSATFQVRRSFTWLQINIWTSVILVVLISLFVSMFEEKYFIFLMPFLLIWLGWGMSRLSERRWVQVILTALVLGGMIVALFNYRFVPAFAKSRSWHVLFDYLATVVRPGDAVVYTFADPSPEVYTAGRWPILILPTHSPPDPNETFLRATQIAQDYDRIWMIPQWSPLWDEYGLAEKALDAACERVAEVRIDAPEGAWPLVLYHTPRFYRQEVRPLDAQFEGGIRLLGYVLRDRMGQAVDRLTGSPGDVVRLTLYWQAERPIEQDYVVFTHVLDQTGWLRGQQDNQPRNGTFPTRAWVLGEWVVDIYRIPIDPAAPPGAYVIEVGMYRPADGERLKVGGADADAENRRVVIK